MKTAISIPGSVFEAAEKVASRLSMSRSQFYTKAVESLVASLSEVEVTSRLNEVYAETSSPLDPVVADLQSLSISPDAW